MKLLLPLHVAWYYFQKATRQSFSIMVSYNKGSAIEYMFYALVLNEGVNCHGDKCFPITGSISRIKEVFLRCKDYVVQHAILQSFGDIRHLIL